MRKITLNVSLIVLAVPFLIDNLRASSWDPSNDLVAVHRSYLRGNGDHLYSLNPGEGPGAGYKAEGVLGYLYSDPAQFSRNLNVWKAVIAGARDDFELAIAENRFAEAWSMPSNTPPLKRIALAESKKRLEKLVGQSVFRAEPAKLAEARAIAAAFPAEPRAELDLFITAEEAAARATLAGLTPDAAARTAALRSVADRLFG